MFAVVGCANDITGYEIVTIVRVVSADSVVLLTIKLQSHCSDGYESNWNSEVSSLVSVN